MPSQTILYRPEDLQPGQAEVVCMFPIWFVPRSWQAPAGSVFCGFPKPAAHESLPQQVEAFLQAGPPPIVFGFHGNATKMSNFMARARPALERRRMRAIVVTKPESRIGSQRSDLILVCNDVTVARLAAHACAVVHDGDSRIAAAALMAGVPQIITGSTAWARSFGWRLRELEAGLRVPGGLRRPRATIARAAKLLQDERVRQRLADLAADIATQDPDAELRRARDNSRGVVTMSTIGRFGRFGNQIFQYAYLKTVAHNNGYDAECAIWPGDGIFGRRDERVLRQLPMAFEQTDDANIFDAYPELLKSGTPNGGEPLRVGAEALTQCPPNIDLCGNFMFHTSIYAPHKDYIRSLFVPADEVKKPLDDAVAKLRARGETLIGLQVRRGDFLSSPIAPFTFDVPPEWWRSWVRKQWDAATKPVLFIASDEPDAIAQELREFSPVTAKDLGAKLPPRAAHAGFFMDHYILSHCDVLAISNSTFGFTACLLNANARTFARASLDAADHFESFDPWNTTPLVRFGKRPSGKSLGQIMSITYRTQGAAGVAKCLGYYLPRAVAMSMMFRGVLAYRADGLGSALKSMARAAVLR